MTHTESRDAYLDDVEHGGKLQEYEHLASFKKGFKEPLEDDRLPARVDRFLIHDELLRPRVKRPVKQEAVR